MKRILGLFLDILFFWSLVFLVGVLGLAVIYYVERDISVINIYLQNFLTPAMLLVYSVFTILYLKYFWIFPTILKQTLGQRLAGSSFRSDSKITLWSVFLKTIAGRFWDWILFPVTLYYFVKKRPLISTRLSGITISNQSLKNSPIVYFFATTFLVILVGALGIGTYVYRTGYVTILEQFTNYEKQLETLTEKLAFQDATYSLSKYKQYTGADKTYAYYNCIIEANLSIDETALNICSSALAENQNDNKRVIAIYVELAKIHAATYELPKAEELYRKLWNDYSYRELDMKNYVVVLSELGKEKEAEEILSSLAAILDEEDVVELRDFGHLYERINKNQLALDSYKKALSTIEEGENDSFSGELHYYVGVIYYKQAKYDDAKNAFEKAKELNKDFAEPAESYIILIKDLKNSIT